MAEKKPPKGAPKWTMTFADLSTLLLTFFVLMLSFASIDIAKFRDLLGSVQNAFGVKTSERGDFQPTAKEDKGGESLENKEITQKLEKMAEQIEEVVVDNDLKEQTEMKVGSNAVRIRITGQLMFSLGKADIKPQAFKFLDGIVDALKAYNYYLLVEGHTDSLKISTYHFPSNWELSSARASAVVRYLIEKGIKYNRLSGIGHAYNYPIATNKTYEGRNLNRRVEFIFTRTPFRTVLDN